MTFRRRPRALTDTSLDETRHRRDHPARADRLVPWLRTPVLVVLVLTFLLAAVAGAYGDWMWWEVYSGLMITLAAGAALLLAAVLAIVPRGRPLAAGLGVVGIGLLAGQNLGPSRPALLQGEGTMRVTLTEPLRTSGSIPATCATDDGLTELQVSGDPNLRLNIVPDNPAAPADIDQREVVGVYLTVGDRWRRSSRPDTRALEVTVGRVEADAPESRMRADTSSTLEIEWTATGGSARFAGLIADTRFEEATGDFIDLVGSIEWTCAPAATQR